MALQLLPQLLEFLEKPGGLFGHGDQFLAASLRRASSMISGIGHQHHLARRESRRAAPLRAGPGSPGSPAANARASSSPYSGRVRCAARFRFRLPAISSGTVPISRRYVRTGSLTLSPPAGPDPDPAGLRHLPTSGRIRVWVLPGSRCRRHPARPAGRPSSVPLLRSAGTASFRSS